MEAIQNKREQQHNNGRRGFLHNCKRTAITGVLLSIGLVISIRAHAQTNAQLIGVVTDPSAAVIPSARVEVSSLSNNAVYHAVTDEQGRYSFLTLPPGQYRVKVTCVAFKTLERTIALTVDDHANLNLQMQIGTQTEVVEVSASEAPLVNATNSTVGTVVEQKEIADLPLNGRNFASLITLTPGVSGVDVSQNGAGPAVQGQRNRDNTYSADGASIAAISTGVIAMTPPLDSIQEFRVQSVNGDAEFGASGGGTVNLVTKSGTNTFTGSVYDYVRNSALDARNTFQPKIAPYKQNQFGSSLGGPIFIPHLMPRSTTKTYFFVSYEGLRLRQNSSALGIVPTAAQLSGNFSGFNPIYNPFSTTPDPKKPNSYLRTQFPGNQILTSLLNPTAVAYAKAYLPAPNYSSPSNSDNFINTSSAFTNNDTWMGRVDQTVNSRNRVYARWLQANYDSGNVLPIGNNLQSGSVAYPRNLSIEWDSTLSQNALLTVGYGYSRSNIANQTPSVPDFYNSSGYNNPDGYPLNVPSIALIPAMTITGYTTYLPQGYGPTVVNGNSPSATLQWIRGKHTFKVGFNMSHMFSKNSGLNPAESFNALQTENLEAPSGTGDALASFLLGVPFTGGRFIGTPVLYMNSNFYSTYAQDTIRFSSRLTMNVGLRWDMAGRFHTNSTIGSFNQETGNTWWLTGPVNADSVFQGPNVGAGILNPVYLNVGPRFGIAYQINPKTILRTGYGLFFDTVAGRWQYVQGPRTAWPFGLFQSTPTLNANTVQVSITNPFVGQQSTVDVANPFLTSTGAAAYPTGAQNDPNFASPRVDEYNLALERQFTDRFVASVTYVGAIGHKLDCCGLINQAYVNGPTAYNQSARPFPLMGVFRTDQNRGYSNYNALELKAQQNASHGLTALVSYTYSKSLDLGCSGYIGAEGCHFTQPYNLAVDYGPSDFDLRHIANFSVVYALPFGRGKRFNTQNYFLDLLAGGWQASGIFTIRSGMALNPVLSNTGQTNIGTGVSPRPNLIGNTKIANQSRSEYFNVSAFALPAGYNYGTAGKNILRGPMNHGENISLFKNFALPQLEGKSTQLQYRVDMFNAFNTTQLGNPGVTQGTSTFGQISTVATPGRIIQMAVRFIY